MSLAFRCACLATIAGATAFSIASSHLHRPSIGRAVSSSHLRRQTIASLARENDPEAKETELRESDADSADSGPKILMPPTELLDVMPSNADSFAGYLAPYAVLVLGAFALASAAFALLVLQG